MTEVNIRELKSRLSYYIKLMQTGEVIVIKDRSKRVGFLTQEASRSKPDLSHKKRDLKKLKTVLEQLKVSGLINSAEITNKLPPFRPIKPSNPNVGYTSDELIRKIRDEEI